MNVYFFIFVIFINSSCQACRCPSFEHCCLDWPDLIKTTCRSDTLRCLDSSFAVDTNKKCLTSPGYPINYPDNSHTKHTLSVAGQAIQITWSHFDVEAHHTCSYDYLEFFDGNGNSVFKKFCGNASPPTLTISTSTASVVFHSDGSIRKKGFKFCYEPDRRCDRPKSLMKPPCPKKCAEDRFWCEEQGECIGKKEVCDCGPDKAYCFYTTAKTNQYRCVDRAEVGRSEFSWCPDGSCATRCRGKHSTFGCPDGQFPCGQECKNQTEIVENRSCEGGCISSSKFCYFNSTVTSETPAATNVSLVYAFVFVVIVLVGLVGLVGVYYQLSKKANYRQ